jgi:hypothetical protein
MSGIKILKASYGTGTTTVDVTKAVSSQIKDGVLNLTVTPDSLNVTDPAPGQQKILDVSYTINNGSTMGQMVKDNEVLMISAPPERRATGLQITKAEYGYAGNFVDVTDAIQNHVRNGSIKIKVGPSTAGVPDPNPNKLKTLSVQYELNGASNSIDLTDGKTLNISAPPEELADNKTPSQHAMSLFGMVYMAIGKFLAMFLYTLSIYTCMDLEVPTGFPAIALGAIGVVLPYVAFWGLPIVLFFRRLFYTTDLVV